jgi:hypothetical protein
MATHDYVIDNQSAPAFRSDLNNALLAIVSQNSASSAPPTTYANMFWYDTANNQLKKRNEANSAWITLGTIDEGTGTFTPSGERALASQAQAEAGSDNTTVMTPLRTAQAIDAQVVIPPAEAYTLLGTLTTTSGSTQTLSGLTLTSYRNLYIDVRNVSTTSSSSVLRLDGLTVSSTFDATTDRWFGIITVDLGNGTYAANVVRLPSGQNFNASTTYAGDMTITSASTSVSFTTSAGTFDAGSILVYGVK